MVAAYLLVAFSALHACACALFGTLFVLRRAPEHRAFALLSALITGYAGSHAAFEFVDTAAARELAVRVGWVFGPVAGAGFLDFVSCLAPPRRPGRVAAGYALALLGAGVAMLGPIVDPDALATERAALETPLLPAAAVIAVVTLTLAAAAAASLVMRLRRDREARLVGATSLVAMSPAVLGEVLRWTHGATYLLLDLAALIFVCAVSVILLQRFAATAIGLAEQTAALEAATAALERTRQEQVRKGQLAALGELSASVAHEVRNPLAIMKNAISGMRRSTLDGADRTTLLLIVSEETDRLTRLVRDLLAFARPRRDTATPTQLRTLVMSVVEEVGRSRRAGAPVAIDVRVPNALAVSGDPELLRLAIFNVVDNAVHAMPRGGALTIEARILTGVRPATVEIIFRDEGEGMDPAVRDKALDPFFSTRAAGTGLGLAIVNNVVRSHGGDVTLESEPGTGTTVCIRVPMVRPPA